MNEHADTPLVSVVIATHAGDSFDFLGEAVESALLQTHRKIEVLVVADGPIPVETQAYLSERAQQDSRLTLLRMPENRGPGAARNFAIARANGNYIAILDADDRALPYRIEQQVAFLRSSGADAAGSAYRIIDEDGRDMGVKRFPLDPVAIRNAMAYYNPIANSTVLAKTDVLKENAYPESFRYGEDYALWIRLVRTGHVLRNQPEVLVEFRNDARFFYRRRGLHRATTELVNRFNTLPLYSAYKWPVVIGAAVVVSTLRLLPAMCLRPAYWLRNRFGCL